MGRIFSLFLIVAAIAANLPSAQACSLDAATEASRQSNITNCANWGGIYEQLYWYPNQYSWMCKTDPSDIWGGNGHGVYYSTCNVPPPPPPVATTLPPTTPNSCPIGGSVIHPTSRIVEESIPVAGTPFFLNYSSGRAFGYSGYRVKHIDGYIGFCSMFTFDGGGVGIPPECGSRKFEATVAGRTFISNISNADSNGYWLHWDGLDSSSNQVLGSAMFSVSITDIPHETYEAPVTYSEPIGSFYAIGLGLGGWTISPVHFLDINRKTVFRGDGTNFRALATVAAGPTYIVASEDGKEVYTFDSTGRHIQTKTGLKGAVKYSITYSSGKIATITDSFSNVTTINYDGSGNPSSIVGPYGHTTALTVDTNKYLATVTNPSSEVFNMTYYASPQVGLLHTFQKPKGVVSTMSYDADGLLTYDSSSAGSSTSLTPVLWGVDATTNLGVTSKYTIIGAGYVGGEIHTINRSGTYASELEYTTVPDGYVITVRGKNGNDFEIYDNRGVDPRFPSSIYTNYEQLKTANYTRTVSTTKSATLSDPNNFFSVVDLTTQHVLNSSKTTTISYLASTSKFTRTTPVGRKNYVTIDAYERPSSIQYATFTPTTLSYDSHGRIASVAQGSSRTTTLGYDLNGNLQTITNPLSQVKTFGYDNIGRVTSETLPDARIISYTYDSNGNLASVTPPGGLAHTFLSNGFDLVEKYVSPAISFMGLKAQSTKAISKIRTVFGTSLRWIAEWFSGIFPTASKKLTILTVNRDTDYAYSLDKKLTSVTRPDGAVATYTYDGTNGRLTAVTTPTGSYSISNSPYYDRIDSITSPDGVVQSFTQEGPFLLSTINTGSTSGSVYFTYNNDFLIGSTKVNTAAVVSYTYDNDGLVAAAGNETVTRNATTGFPTKTTLANVSENYTYSTAYGELASIQGKYSTATNIYLESITRDDLARVTSKTETIGVATPNTYVYTFDTSGRLTAVTKNGSAYSAYVYDANSNRTSTTRAGITTAATYDEQDRIVTFGTKTYTHNDAGELTQMSDAATTPASVTSYTYDVFGNLKSVTLPSGSSVSYLLDGQNRRVGRKVGATMQKQFLWFDQIRPAAELNGTGTLVSQFIYGLKGNVPDYIIKSSVKYKVMTDHLGSVVAVVNSSTGVVAQALSYDEFGRVLSDTAPGFQPFGFAGGLYDSDTKIVTFGARSYDAETGRWLSKDPILFGGGDSNLYGYVLADPVNLIDPSGLDPGDRFSTPTQAATDVIRFINPTSIKENREYAGTIDRNKDGTYSASVPRRGTEHNSSAKAGPSTTAFYHTHGADSPGYADERFSKQDKLAADFNLVDAYLGTPSGNILFYNSDTNNTSNVGHCP